MPMPSARPAEPDLLRFDRSGALLRKVMESAAVGMKLIGLDGRTLYINRSYAMMLGLGPDATAEEINTHAIYEEDLELIRLHFNRVLRGESEELRLECRLQRRDGTPFWVLLTGSVVHDDATGEPACIVAQVIDIDRQKRAEAALTASESRWNFALEAAGQGVWDHDIRNDDMFYSRMWRRMRGIPDDEEIDPAQEKWLARIHPDDVARVRGRIKQQDHGDDGYDALEYRERHRNGHYVWIMSRGRPVEWDAEGNPTRTVGTDTDITRFKEIEAQLAAEKERLHVTLESIGDGVISTDADERVLYMNPAAEAMTGWQSADAFGRRLEEVFSARLERSGLAAPDAVARCLMAGATVGLGSDVLLIGKDGASRPIHGTAAPLRAAGGQPIGSVLVFRDVTESRELQRQLAYSATHDALTGLPNRPAFEEALAEARHQAAAEARQHALCFIDLDRFKPVNDTAGHAAGDALLREVADIIRAVARPQDFAARIGGDEFVLLLADCSSDCAHLAAARIIQTITRMEFRWNTRAFRIGASIGVAVIGPQGAGGDPLIAADAACYAAKSGGRGRVVLSA